MNLSVALGTLDVLAVVLREGEAPVKPSDLLAVVLLLKQVSNVEVQEGEELKMLEQLSQYYVEVTEFILEEHNIETWSSVSQVTWHQQSGQPCATSVHLAVCAPPWPTPQPQGEDLSLHGPCSLSGCILELKYLQ